MQHDIARCLPTHIYSAVSWVLLLACVLACKPDHETVTYYKLISDFHCMNLIYCLKMQYKAQKCSEGCIQAIKDRGKQCNSKKSFRKPYIYDLIEIQKFSLCSN